MFEQGIEDFWEWWNGGGRAELETAIAGEGSDDIADTISGLVADIHPSLEWQLAPGLSARHALALSGGGLGTLRIMTQQWVESGPPADADWEFHGARIPVEPPPMSIGDVELDPATIRWIAEPDSVYEQLNLTFSMDGFHDLDDEGRMQAVLTYLDAVLGEDDSETWVGIIDPADEPPRGGQPLDALASRVAEYSQTTTGEGWEVVESEQYGAYSIATINRALKHLHFMDHILHCEIVVKLNDVTPMGLPSEVESADQDEIEEDALSTIGSQGVFVGRETVDGHRHLHFFVKDSETFADAIADWAEEFDSHVVTTTVTLDPDWSVLNRWL